MELAEFVMARLAEDEEDARACAPNLKWPDGADELPAGIMPHATLRHSRRWDPARVLAECEAKRRIVRDYEIARDAEYGDIAAAIADERTYGRFLRLFAIPYADHPDYREEWRP